MAGSRDGKTHFYERDGGGNPYWYHASEDDVNSVSLSWSGSFLAVGTSFNDGKVYLFNTSSSSPLWSHAVGSGVEVTTVSISSGGQYLVAGSSDNYLYYFDRDSNLFVWRIATEGDIAVVDIDATGTYILVGDDEGLVSYFGSPYLKRVYITGWPSGIVQYGDTVTFNGTFDAASAGEYLAGYYWVSDIDGLLSNSTSFSTSGLSVGNHSISFEA